MPLDRPPFRWTLACGLRQRCPCCGLGRLFAGVWRMKRVCATCGLSYYRESGYFVGAMILNYAFTSFIVIALYVLNLSRPEVSGLSLNTKVFLWLALTVALSLALVRPAYSLWLAFDYWLEPWEPGPPSPNP